MLLDRLVNSIFSTLLPSEISLKTETVLNLFKDVDYTLSNVRAEKLVKPIYFTQFLFTLIALSH